MNLEEKFKHLYETIEDEAGNKTDILTEEGAKIFYDPKTPLKKVGNPPRFIGKIIEPGVVMKITWNPARNTNRIEFLDKII